MDHGSNGSGMNVSFTQADQPLIGMNSNPKVAGKFRELESLDISTMTPLEALNTLQRLKEKLAAAEE